MVKQERPQIDLEGHDLVGVVGSMYDDPENSRYQIALRTALAYQIAEVPLIVVDASSDTFVVDAMQERGAHVIRPNVPGLATQYIEGVDYAVANGANKVVRHEPEKEAMINFRGPISDALDTSDIVVIGRTPKAMDSLPTAQAHYERAGADFMRRAFSFPPDAWSGGRGYTVDGATLLSNYDVERWGNNWMHLYVPVLEAMERGIPVAGLALDLMHPPEMTREEEGDTVFTQKRQAQFELQVGKLSLYHLDVWPGKVLGL